ncbi:hypothetical protein Tco_0129470 [Tanacetum coccineum]
MFSLVWIMPPKVMTQSAGRPAAERQGGGTGVRVGRGVGTDNGQKDIIKPKKDKIQAREGKEHEKPRPSCGNNVLSSAFVGFRCWLKIVQTASDS